MASLGSWPREEEPPVEQSMHIWSSHSPAAGCRCLLQEALMHKTAMFSPKLLLERGGLRAGRRPAGCTKHSALRPAWLEGKGQP